LHKFAIYITIRGLSSGDDFILFFYLIVFVILFHAYLIFTLFSSLFYYA